MCVSVCVGVPVDIKRAEQLWIRCARRGHIGGLAKCYQFGLDNMKMNVSSTVKLLHELINTTNDIDAIYSLAFYYRKEKNDMNEARKLYLRGEYTCYPMIMNDLAWMYYSCDGVELNVTNGNECLRSAAMNGCCRACYHYATRGVGLTKREKQALIDRAAQLGFRK